MPALDFERETEEEESEIGLLPAGEYLVVIDNTDYTPTKNGKGMILKVVYKVIEEGDFNGRKLFETLCIRHENEQTRIIAQKAFNSICLAVGTQSANIKNSEELHDIPMIVKVGVQKDEGYGDKNRILKHLSANANSAPAPVQSQKQAPVKSSTPQGNGGQPTGGKPWNTTKKK